MECICRHLKLTLVHMRQAAMSCRSFLDGSLDYRGIGRCQRLELGSLSELPCFLLPQTASMHLFSIATNLILNVE